MAWTYSDWITQGGTTQRVARLRLHIQEVSEQLTAKMGHSGREFDPDLLRTYRKELMEELNRLDPTGAGDVATSARATAGFTRGIPV